jgi:predicted transcriptional regulator
MTTVKEIMTHNLIFAESDWSLLQLSQLFFDNHISGAPVVDINKQLIGVVSLSDLSQNATSPVHNTNEQPHDFYLSGMLEKYFAKEEIAAFQIESESLVTVNEIMTPMIFEVDENTTVQKAADIMVKGHIHRIFVRSNSSVVGVVTAMDMLKIVRDLPFQ